MWQVIFLLVIVSIVSLMIRPKENFFQEPTDALDIYKGFNYDIEKTEDAMKDRDKNIMAETGEFNSLTGTVADFESVNVKNDMKIGGRYVNLPSDWNVIKSGGRLHLSSGERTYLLPKNGVIISRAWGGSGNLNVEGNVNLKGGVSEHNPGKWGTHFPWSGDQKNYIRGDTELRGNTNNLGDLNVGRYLNIKGGKSEHNPGNWWTHFAWQGDQKNYIRGDTEIRGNTDNIGDLNVGRRLHIGGSGTAPSSTNDSDPYYFQKIRTSANNNTLRLTINDDANEAFEIWGDSCGARNCAGPGTQKHRFVANGDAEHKGSLTVGGTLNVGGQTLTAADIQKLKRL